MRSRSRCQIPAVESGHLVQNHVISLRPHRIGVLNNALMFIVNPGFAFPELNVSSTISHISRCATCAKRRRCPSDSLNLSHNEHVTVGPVGWGKT
jgi:hypothetical protein